MVDQNLSQVGIQVAAVSGTRGVVASPTAALNAMSLPAIALDRHGCVVDANSAAEAVFDNNIKVKDRRLFVRDPDSRNLLKEAIDQLTGPPRLNSLAVEPIIIPRKDKLPVIVRIWPFEGPEHQPALEVRALLTLNALGPRPGPPATILAKAFCLTPSEAKLPCIIARGAPPDIADHRPESGLVGAGCQASDRYAEEEGEIVRPTELGKARACAPPS